MVIDYSLAYVYKYITISARKEMVYHRLGKSLSHLLFQNQISIKSQHELKSN